MSYSCSLGRSECVLSLPGPSLDFLLCVKLIIDWYSKSDMGITDGTRFSGGPSSNKRRGGKARRFQQVVFCHSCHGLTWAETEYIWRLMLVANSVTDLTFVFLSLIYSFHLENNVINVLISMKAVKKQ